MVKLKRAYDPVSDEDGRRILVDRLWPRGVRKVDARIDLWAKEVAPTAELCKWFSHDPEKWLEFQQRYKEELADHAATLNEIASDSAKGVVTLIFAARDQQHNEAVVLKAVIDELAI